MKAVWQGRVMQATSKYGEHAPMAAVCCNVCRTCTTTNIVGAGIAAVAGVGAWFTQRLSRVANPS
jgi:hypothetical protein